MRHNFHPSDVTPQHQTLLQRTRDAVAAVDERGEITFWNTAAETLLGYTAEEATGQTLSSLLLSPGDSGQDDSEHQLARFLADTTHEPVPTQPFQQATICLEVRHQSGQRLPLQILRLDGLNNRHTYTLLIFRPATPWGEHPLSTEDAMQNLLRSPTTEEERLRQQLQQQEALNQLHQAALKQEALSGRTKSSFNLHYFVAQAQQTIAQMVNGQACILVQPLTAPLKTTEPSPSRFHVDTYPHLFSYLNHHTIPPTTPDTFFLTPATFSPASSPANLTLYFKDGIPYEPNTQTDALSYLETQATHLGLFILGDTNAPSGLLIVGTTREQQHFQTHEIDFLQSVTRLLNSVITRYQKETTRRKNEERYRLVQDATNDGIWDWNIVTGELFWSDRLYEIFGLSAQNHTMTEEMIARLIHPDDRILVQTHIQNHLMQGIPFESEMRILQPEGGYRYVQCRGKAIRNEHGDALRMIGTITDIHERKQQEQALKESEELFRTLANNMNAFIWMSDDKANITYINRHWIEFTGLSYEKSLGRAWVNIIHPDDLEESQRLYFEAYQKREARSWEVRFQHKDGEYHNFLIQAGPRYLSNGEFIDFLGSALDITDLKQIQHSLEESENRFRSLADASPIMIAVFDENGYMTYYNEASRQFTGKAIESYPNEFQWMEFIHEADRGNIFRLFQKNIPKHNSFSQEFRAIRHDGAICAFLSTVVPRFKVNGEFAGYIVVSTDITAQKESETRFRRIVDSNMVGIVYWKKDGRITDANDAFLHIIGYPPEALQAGTLNWRELTPPEFIQADENSLSLLDEKGVCLPFEKELFHRDGYRVHVMQGSASLPSVTDDEGVTLILDITPLKSFQQALEKRLANEQLSRRVLEITSQAIPIDTILNDVAQEIGRFFQADRCIILKYDAPELAEEFNHFTLPGQYCAAPRFAKLEAADLPESLWQILTQTSPQYPATRVLKLESPDQYLEYLCQRAAQGELDPLVLSQYRQLMKKQMVQNLDLQSCLRISIAYKGKEYGAIVLHQCTHTQSQKPLAWDDESINLLNDLGYHIGSAVYQMELHQQEQSAKQKIEQSYDLINMVNEAQNHFITNEETHNLFQNLLTRLLSHTESQTGFIGEVIQDTSKFSPQQYELLTMLTDHGNNASSDASVLTLPNTPNLPQFLLQQVLKTGQVIHWRNPNPPQNWIAGEVETHELPEPSIFIPQELATLGIQNFIGLPCYKGDQLVGLVGLGNRKKQYTLAMAERLQPFLAACANIMVGNRNEAIRKKLTLDLQISESAAKDYAAKLEHSNQELEQFATIASHDLQAPLRKVILFSEYLRTSTENQLSPESLDYLDRMQRAILKMQSLITDLLALSRITRKAQPFKPVDLKPLIDDIISDFEPTLKETQGRIEVGETLTIEADSTQLRQVFQNLISNALKFQRPNVQPVIHITTRIDSQDPDYCQIVVEDNGIGFDEKYLDRIFDIFERLHTEQKYEGTGIGLAVVRKIVDRHRGHLTARSTPGVGSKFIITLPISQQGQK